MRTTGGILLLIIGGVCAVLLAVTLTGINRPGYLFAAGMFLLVLFFSVRYGVLLVRKTPSPPDPSMLGDTPMEITSSCSRGDYVRLSYGLVYRNSLVQLLILLAIVLAGVGFMHDDMLSLFLRVIAGVIVLMFTAGIYPVAALAYGRNGHLLRSNAFVISREGLRMTNESVRVDMTWDMVRRVVNLKGYLLVYVTGNQAIIIKKSDLDPATLEQLMSIFFPGK